MTPLDLAVPLAAHALAWRERHRRPLLLGISGAQGSGKSTLAAALVAALANAGRRAATLSLDDLYLGRAARQDLARRGHPLFATRGPPGTHDVTYGLAVIDALVSGTGPVAVPRFDKGMDDRAPSMTVVAPLDVVVFEGWCLGATPQPETALMTPVNALEASDDPHAIWRRAVNAALAADYRPLWDRLDLLVQLRAPDWSVVADWRAEQDAALGARAMAPAALARFMAHYERLTRHMLAGGIARRGQAPDIVVDLDGGRGVIGATGLAI